ncbi:hypothetical protein SAMN04488505_112172 [Chitinophaga rupis]|uniref:Gliding motility-associated protein GldM C-terminal domain-containing protein n=1 Tax=Chitinophaga rupis TaxID=573321 RepID=A0A1H8J2M9_9BACT|nr:hypothetical protein [Chitinophaga rupis]SEN74982.1 hypothetical protein SAMN04488505_112172 [Chitinophaga rupis]
MKGYLFLTFLWLPFMLHAQKHTVKSIVAYYDTTAVVELYNQAPIGLEITYTNGEIRSTEGFLKGDYRWKYIKVTSPDGTCRNGVLTFDRSYLAQNRYQVKLLVTLPDAEQPIEAALQLPYVTGIRFHHYADSLKRDIHFYLNVEGRFNTGKIYPLDTASIQFETSAGQLLGQDLLLNKTDTTRFINVTATYRDNPSLVIHSVIPVKQKPDDDSMIINDERQLYNNNKKKKRG